MISPTVLNTPHGTQDIPHIYHDIPHGTEHPPRYSRYPPTVLMISPTVLMISPTVLNTPHGTEHPPRYCTHIIQGEEVVLYSVIEHSMTSFHFQTAQKNSASLRSSVRQFENSMTSYRALLLHNARLPMF